MDHDVESTWAAGDTLTLGGLRSTKTEPETQSVSIPVHQDHNQDDKDLNKVLRSLVPTSIEEGDTFCIAICKSLILGVNQSSARSNGFACITEYSSTLN
jgi:hypothetical protein